MSDPRVNLQTNQSLEGNETIDKNGWPTPLTDPSNPLKFVVENGSRGSIENFRAMRTSRQDDVSLPEGRSSVRGEGLDGLKIEIKKNENDSLSHDTGKGDF